MKSNKFVRGIFGLILSCFVIVGITSCEPPSGGNGLKAPELVTPVAANLSEFEGTWVNDDWGWHSEYVVSSTIIKDVSMECEFNVVSENLIKTNDSQDKYTLVIVQTKQGTESTPIGFYYVIGLLKKDGNLRICCPLDYASRFTSIEQIVDKYTNSKFEGSGNCDTVCTKLGKSVTLNSEYFVQITFEEDKVAFYPGTAEPEWYFVPKRNTNKEKGNVYLYLYSEQDQSGGVDRQYLTIQDDEDGKVVYWYNYEEESEEEDQNDEALANMYPECMPTVSDSDLTKILALYK